MTVSLLQLRRLVVSILIAACVVAPLAHSAGATSLASTRALADDGSAESSRSVGLMTGAEPGTASLNEAGDVEVSRSVGLMTGASDTDSPLQASGAGVLEISRSVGLMEGAPGGAYGMTLDQTVL